MHMTHTCPHILSMGKYIHGEVHIYVGYIQTDERLKNYIRKYVLHPTENDDNFYSVGGVINNEIYNNLTELFPHGTSGTATAPGSAKIKYGVKYPIIFYSGNNGKTFTTIDIPNIGDLTDEEETDFVEQENENGDTIKIFTDPNKKSMIPSMNDDLNQKYGKAFEDIICKSIVKSGNRIKIYYEAGNEIIGYTAFLISQTSTTDLISYEGKNFELTPDEQTQVRKNNSIINTWKNFSIDAVDLAILRGLPTDEPLLDPDRIRSSNKFFKESKFNFKINDDQVVLESGVDQIRYSNPIEIQHRKKIRRPWSL